MDNRTHTATTPAPGGRTAGNRDDRGERRGGPARMGGPSAGPARSQDMGGRDDGGRRGGGGRRDDRGSRDGGRRGGGGYYDGGRRSGGGRRDDRGSRDYGHRGGGGFRDGGRRGGGGRRDDRGGRRGGGFDRRGGRGGGDQRGLNYIGPDRLKGDPAKKGEPLADGSQRLMVEEREFVVPGKLLGEGDFKSGYGTYMQDRSVYSSIAGLMTRRGEFINVIPVNGKYNPQEGDMVIGIVSDLTPSSWLMDINGPNPAPMGTSETPWEVDFGATGNFIGLNEVVLLRVIGVDEIRRVQVSMKGPGFKKLTGGILYEMPPPKVPRVIGKSGSMINLLKKYTGCQIVVAQNGRIWIDGTQEGMDVAYKCLDFIHNDAHTSGLTDKVEDFLKTNAPAHLMRKETPEEKPAPAGDVSRRDTGRSEQARPEQRDQARPEQRDQARPEQRDQARPEQRDQARPEQRDQARPEQRDQGRRDHRGDRGRGDRRDRRDGGGSRDGRDGRGQGPPAVSRQEPESQRVTPPADRGPQEPAVKMTESPLDATREEMRREMEQKQETARDGGDGRGRDGGRDARHEHRHEAPPAPPGQRDEGVPPKPAEPATPPAGPAVQAPPAQDAPVAKGFGAMAPAAERMKEQEKKPGLFGN